MGVSKELLMRRRNLGSPHIATATGAVASFAGNMAAPFKECKCEFTPVQSGTGDPSPSNVRPISGWTGCNVARCGKNLFNENADAPMVNCFNYQGTAQTRRGIVITVPAGTYTVKANNSGSQAYINVNVINFDGSFAYYNSIVSGQDVPTRTFTVTAGQYIVIYDQQATSASTGTKWAGWDIQLELGSTATPYEPYTGNTYAVDWTDEAGTVYGGNVDPVRGVLRAEWGMVDLGTVNWTIDVTAYQTAYVRSGQITNVLYDENVVRWICSAYQSKTIKTASSTLDNYVWVDNNGRPRVKNKNLNELDADAFKIAMSGVMLVYQLATPIEYPLTPQVIKTLKGVNNVFSNLNGNTTVQYFKH